MIDHIVLDVEIKTPIDKLPDGWSSTHLMGVSCCVCYEMNTDRYLIYGDTKGELEDLKMRVLKADRITTWNGWGFDFPVIFGLQKSKKVDQLLGFSDDMLRRCWLSQQINPEEYNANTHGGWSLDAVAKATLGSEGKTGSGASAPLLYKQGQWGRLVDYCLNDVKLTRDLCIHADKTGYLLGKNGLYARVGKDWQV